MKLIRLMEFPCGILIFTSGSPRSREKTCSTHCTTAYHNMFEMKVVKLHVQSSVTSHLRRMMNFDISFS
jgi:hypothetical protein